MNLSLGNFFVSLADDVIRLVGTDFASVAARSRSRHPGIIWLLLFGLGLHEPNFSESPQDVVGRFKFSNRVVIFALVSLLKTSRSADACIIGFSGLIHASLGLLLDEGGGAKMGL